MADKLDRLAELIAQRAERKLGAKAKLRVIGKGNLRREIPSVPLPSNEDPIMREHRIARVRWLSKHYGLDVVVRQHTFGRTGIDALDADELVALHKAVESAFDTVLQGFPIDEAGFVSLQGEL